MSPIFTLFWGLPVLETAITGRISSWRLLFAPDQADPFFNSRLWHNSCDQELIAMFAHLKTVPRGGDLVKPRASQSPALYLIKLRELSSRSNRVEFRVLLTSGSNDETAPPTARSIRVSKWEATSTKIPLR